MVRGYQGFSSGFMLEAHATLRKQGTRTGHLEPITTSTITVVWFILAFPDFGFGMIRVNSNGFDLLTTIKM